jgi:hypothetical protein
MRGISKNGSVFFRKPKAIAYPGEVVPRIYWFGL